MEGQAYGISGAGGAAAARLLCDEMLRGLGRWLRAAGHDTLIVARGATDSAVLERAFQEGRLLVTRDREFAVRRRAAGRVVILEANGLEAAARELGERLAIDWLYAPFTRCLVDNALLRPASDGELVAVPWQARVLGGALSACPDCGRVYWPGSHVRRMATRLRRWQLAQPSAGHRNSWRALRFAAMKSQS